MQPQAPSGARWRCSHTHSRPKCSASMLHVGGTGKRLVNCRSRQTPVASHLHERPAHELHRAAAAAEVEHDPVQPLLQTWQQNLVPSTRWRWRPIVLLQGADCRCCSGLNSTGLFHGPSSPLSPRTCGPSARHWPNTARLAAATAGAVRIVEARAPLASCMWPSGTTGALSAPASSHKGVGKQIRGALLNTAALANEQQELFA